MQTKSPTHQQLLPLSDVPVAATKCTATPVGKRRDGGTRYWCVVHKADATAKYGRPAEKCRYADVPAASKTETLDIVLSQYPGGVAFWGAVPPVYDTTATPLERGIHVHARLERAGKKVIDRTYRRVLARTSTHASAVEISELDAIYYMVSRVFGLDLREVVCSRCGYSHLDRDWFSINAHRRHLCAACGRQFTDSVSSVGNPIVGVQAKLGRGSGGHRHKTRASRKKLDISQRDYPGGLQIWGSNPALLWTADEHEEEGIHVHAFSSSSELTPVHDDTYAAVKIDGHSLDAQMVRTLMAQTALPHLKNRVISKRCTKCKALQFSTGVAAGVPTMDNSCSACGNRFAGSGRIRKTIANPAVEVFETLSRLAPRPRIAHDLGLIPETL